MKKIIRITESDLIKIIKKTIYENHKEIDEVDITATAWDVDIKSTKERFEKEIYNSVKKFIDRNKDNIKVPIEWGTNKFKKFISSLFSDVYLGYKLRDYRKLGGNIPNLITKILTELNLIKKPQFIERKPIDLSNIDFDLVFTGNKGYAEMYNLKFTEKAKMYLKDTIPAIDNELKYFDENSVFDVEETKHNSFNRIHSQGLPMKLRGLGLGYAAYKKMIELKGFASSYEDASTLASNIWKKIANDPDFYLIIKEYEKHSADRLLVIHKDYKGDINKLVNNFIKKDKYTIKVDEKPKLRIDKRLENVLGSLSENYDINWS